ncbi:MAG: hypothetical protein CL678_02985 [Bdellovibrionaceae bacterium]|nr:hypothetical protein [Pseudobdellovibrionaceae bacterium]|tara:strand:- start:4184 stop:4711 length:528 start_codon:yes stop_codon:yes gene_type:complete
MNLEGETIYLRRLTIDDAPIIHQWHNDSELYEYLVGQCHSPHMDQVKVWLTDRIKGSEREQTFGICLNDTNTLIGNVYLRNIDSFSKNAEFHIMLGNSKERSKGIGTEVMELIKRMSVDFLGLKRLYLYVLRSNERARKLYQKVGFLDEGVLKSHVRKKDRWVDVCVMGLSLEEK